MIMSLKQRKIKFEPRIKLNHNIYTSSKEIELLHNYSYESTLLEFMVYKKGQKIKTI